MLLLYSICQRYNFESNLQRTRGNKKDDCSCIRYVKDTILKAIYNNGTFHCIYTFAVFDMSKIQFWKQFTTSCLPVGRLYSLYSICQRYNFESNLQPILLSCAEKECCIRYVKDTILKAIYNYSTNIAPKVCAVFDMSKIQFWKQFTTTKAVEVMKKMLYSICQRYNFESNLQPMPLS